MLRKILTALVINAQFAGTPAAEENFSAEQRAMVQDIDKTAAMIGDLTGRAKLDPRVLSAMAEVPRHEFVPASQRRSAYANRPLSIGDGQTISQPFIVALMTDLLQLKATDKVLEVGTGSGYQSAILAKLARDVYSIEIIPGLAATARTVLTRLGYSNVVTKIGDGYGGWPEHAPFDAIIVTAAPEHVPPKLVEQLKPGGRLVIPVGTRDQHLLVVSKNADGTSTTTTTVPVRFVPLVRE